MAGTELAPHQPAPWEEGGAVAGFPLYQKGMEEGSQLCARVVPASWRALVSLQKMHLRSLSLGTPAPAFRFGSF